MTKNEKYSKEIENCKHEEKIKTKYMIRDTGEEYEIEKCLKCGKILNINTNL